MNIIIHFKLYKTHEFENLLLIIHDLIKIILKIILYSALSIKEWNYCNNELTFVLQICFKLNTFKLINRWHFSFIWAGPITLITGIN